MHLHDVLLLARFIGDGFVALAASWLLVCATGHARRGVLEPAIAWLLALVAIVTGVGVVLGETGGFGARGFLLGHVVVLGVLLGARRRALGADVAAARELGRAWRTFLNQRSAASGVVAAVGVVAVALTVIAAWAEPVVMDSLTYHLPRIGHWLQTGRIEVIPTTDERMNFVAVLPDVMMAWLLGGSAEGFKPVVLAQALGGVMAVAGTMGLARHSGLSRAAAALAGGLLLGMANVVAQFTAAQTDLFTAGVFAATFYLWWSALRRGDASWLGAMGAGVALGAKGTLFYLAPGALIWTLWLAWRHPMPWRRWGCVLLGGALGAAIYAGPGFVRNFKAYGDPLGPEPWVRKHHRGYEGWPALGEKLALNLTAAAAQNFEPHSQPIGAQEMARQAGLALAETLPREDPYTLDGRKRREVLQGILQRRTPDADATGFGILAVGLFAMGVIAALVRRRVAGCGIMLMWAAGVVVFVVFFHAMQQWHPFSFRYLVLAAPWIAVVGAWALEQMPSCARSLGWSVVMIASVAVGGHVTFRVHQGGWRTVVEPERSHGAYVARGWRDWSEALRGGECLAVGLPEERPVSAFYRQRSGRRIEYVPPAALAAARSAEALAGEQCGWLVVPVAQFMGREGDVKASVWLDRGDERSPFSIAAFRRLGPGERPDAVVYRYVIAAESGGWRHDLWVKTWGEATLRFTVENPGVTHWQFVVLTPGQSARGEAKAGSVGDVEVPVPRHAVSELRFQFRPADGAVAGGATPRVALRIE